MRPELSGRRGLVIGAALLGLLILVLSQYRLQAGWSSGNITIEPARPGLEHGR